MKILPVITGVIGAAIGSGVTWFLTNRYWLEKSTKELESYKEYFDKRLSELEAKSDFQVSGDDASNTDFCEPKSQLLSNIDGQKPPYKTEPISYSSIISKHYNVDLTEEEEDELEELREKEEEKIRENPIKEKPYVIHMDAYTGDDEIHYKEDYQHITLDYFAGDDVLCANDGNERVDNFFDVVGWDWKNHFGDEKYGCDENCVYVRNDQRRADYEIVRDKGYYCMIILGVDPPNPNEE
jgi:hypothetical protein